MSVTVAALFVDLRVIASEGRMRGANASRTPEAFRDVLLAMARTANIEERIAA